MATQGVGRMQPHEKAEWQLLRELCRVSTLARVEMEHPGRLWKLLEKALGLKEPC